MIREITKEIKIGNIMIGNNHKIAIQSMCNTKTKDINKTIEQIINLEKVGCDIIRVAVLDVDDAKAISEIKKNIHIPLVADIHFDYRLALLAMENGVDKLRINPGNIGDIDKIKKVVDKAKEKNIPIRIGVNMGSLEKDIEKEYGRTAEGLIASAKKHIEILESLDFHNIVLSLKASDIDISTKAYQMASQQFDYPLHIGITESGPLLSGTVKSSLAMGKLLEQGIGDTIRISLTNDPLYEIKVAREILANFNLLKKPRLISCPTCGRTQYNMLEIVEEIDQFLLNFPSSNIKVAIMGCVVNGPGEAKDADIGIAGGKDCVVLFKKGEIIKKVSKKEATSVLKEEILEYITKTSN